MCENKANTWKAELRDRQRKEWGREGGRERNDMASVPPGVPETVIHSIPHLFSYGELPHINQFALGFYSSQWKESIWHKWVKM